MIELCLVVITGGVWAIAIVLAIIADRLKELTPVVTKAFASEPTRRRM